MKRKFMSDDDCAFCNRNKDWILFESENFYVTPDLGAIVEGYLLICSKKHLTSVGYLNDSLLDELGLIKTKVFELLSKNYVSPIFFEHGALNDLIRGGCCIDHLHIHCVPILDNILKLVPKEFVVRQINNFSEIKRILDNYKDYVYYEDQFKNRFVILSDFRFQSQFMRRLVAQAIENPLKWDWREYNEHENFESTLRKLKNECG